MAVAPSELGLRNIGIEPQAPPPHYLEVPRTKYTWEQYVHDLIDTRPGLPQSQNWEIPSHLRKTVLIKQREANGYVDEKLWAERSYETEKRVKLILESQSKIIKEVRMCEPYTKKIDLEVDFINDFPSKDVGIQVKSSTKAMEAFKNEINVRLKKNKIDMNQNEWRTAHHIILINGGVGWDNVEKREDEVLYDSFYPQLLRIMQYEAGREHDAYRTHRKESTEIYPKIADLVA